MQIIFVNVTSTFFNKQTKNKITVLAKSGKIALFYTASSLTSG